MAAAKPSGKSRPKGRKAPRIGVVTGLLRELEALPAQEAMAGAASGARPNRAMKAAEDMIRKDKAAALLSFGLAGGLDPAMKPGDVVIPKTLFGPEGRGFACHMPLVEALRRLIPEAKGEAMAGSDTVVAAVADKRALYEMTGAAAVDMESHAVALAAEEAGVPFAVLRVVADPAGRVLPSAAQGALTADGRIMTGRVLRRLLSRPWQLPALIALGRDSETGFRKLEELGARDPVGAMAAVFGGGATRKASS